MLKQKEGVCDIKNGVKYAPPNVLEAYFRGSTVVYLLVVKNWKV